MDTSFVDLWRIHYTVKKNAIHSFILGKTDPSKCLDEKCTKVDESKRLVSVLGKGLGDAPTRGVGKEEDAYVCAICQDVFVDPVRHVYPKTRVEIMH